MADINVTEEIIDINVTEEVVNIIAPSGGYPLPNTINSVFGRVGNIVATEGDYTLTQIGDVTLTSPANGQVLKYNGTQWVNSTDADTGITTLNTLTALSQTFATGSSGTDFNISSATSTHTFNLPTASATNRGLLSSADWSTFNAKQNALTNPVTGTGTTNTLPKFTGASTIGNSNVSDSGTLITLGSNTTISSGGLGIGTSDLTNYALRIGKAITGSTVSYGVMVDGTIQSDVTADAFLFRTNINTQATSFNLSSIQHFRASQGTLGAGSAVGVQTGFFANSSLVGATTNYGFRGSIPAQTNNWNLYMDGTADNYLAGDTGIGTANPTEKLHVSTGTDADAGLISITLGGTISNSRQAKIEKQTTGTRKLNIYSSLSDTSLEPISFYTGLSFERLTIFEGGNVGIGTTTDAGYRLDVQGSTRFNGLSIIQGTTASDTAPLGSELLTTGTGDASWTGTSFATGYTHVTGSTTTLTSAVAAAIGTYYLISYTVTNRTTGSFTIAFGGASFGSLTATNINSLIGTTTGSLVITPTSDFNGTIVLSIKQVNISSASISFLNSSGGVTNQLRINSDSRNTFFGNFSGERNFNGGDNQGIINTFIGYSTGRNNITGRFNTYLGAFAGEKNVSGTSNVSIGYNSLQNSVTTASNTAIGAIALSNHLSGNLNVAIGESAGRFITGGSTVLTSASNSIFIGQSSRAAADGQTNQIVIGQGATGLGSNTTVIGNSSTVTTALYGDLVLGSTIPVASALLTMTSTTEGFLPPRMTTTQKNAISSPATGLVVFDTTLGKLCVFATTWQTITSV